MDRGQLVYSGDPDHAVRKYLEDFDVFKLKPETDFSLKDRPDRKGNGELRFTRVEFRDQADRIMPQLTLGESVKVCLFYKSQRTYDEAEVLIAFNIYNEQGTMITNINSMDVSRLFMSVTHSGYFECSWNKVNLRPGSYASAIYCSINGEVTDWLQSGFKFGVLPGDFYGLGVPSSGTQGDILVEYDWNSKDEALIKPPI